MRSMDILARCLWTVFAFDGIGVELLFFACHDVVGVAFSCRSVLEGVWLFSIILFLSLIHI